MFDQLKLALQKTNLASLAEHAEKLNLKVDVHSTFFEISRGDEIMRINSDHAHYLEDAINNFGFYYSAVSPVLIGEKKLVDYATPRIHWVKGFNLFPVMCNSFAESMETTEQYLEIAQLPKGGVVLDLGGYSGLTSIRFALALGKSGRVICVEADAHNQVVTRTNLEYFARLGMDAAPIVLEEKAIWCHSDGISFSTDGNMGATAAAIINRADVKAVPSITIAAIAEKYGLERLDFIKCDVEGAEAVLFQNQQEVLRKFRPRLIIEPHYIDGVMSAIAFKPHLEAAGYQLKQIAQQGFPLPLIVGYPVEESAQLSQASGF